MMNFSEVIRLLYILLDEFYGKWIFEIFSLIGSDCGQNGENDVYNAKCHLQESCNAHWPEQSAKPKIVAVNMNVQIVEVAQPMKPEKVPIEQVWPKSNKERDGDQTCHDGVKQHTNLKIKSLFAVIVDKRVLFFVCGP